VRVRIVSSFRLTDPEATEFTWEGEVDVRRGATSGTTNSEIFRMFNRVDALDVERLDALGYTLPSLSAGDLIVWVGTETTHGRMFIVDGVGFREVMPGMGIPERMQA
jgi:hypothetical protein